MISGNAIRKQVTARISFTSSQSPQPTTVARNIQSLQRTPTTPLSLSSQPTRQRSATSTLIPSLTRNAPSSLTNYAPISPMLVQPKRMHDQMSPPLALASSSRAQIPCPDKTRPLRKTGAIKCVKPKKSINFKDDEDYKPPRKFVMPAEKNPGPDLTEKDINRLVTESDEHLKLLKIIGHYNAGVFGFSHDNIPKVDGKRMAIKSFDLFVDRLIYAGLVTAECGHERVRLTPVGIAKFNEMLAEDAEKLRPLI